jgi:hypothetical protein
VGVIGVALLSGVVPEFPVPVLLFAEEPAVVEVPESTAGDDPVAPWTVELPTTVPVPVSEPAGPLLCAQAEIGKMPTARIAKTLLFITIVRGGRRHRGSETGLKNRSGRWEQKFSSSIEYDNAA